MTKHSIKPRILSALFLACLALAALPGRASADTYGFGALESLYQGVADLLYVDVSNTDGGTAATFTFTSAVSGSEVVTSIYWDWSGLDEGASLSSPTWTGSPGASFAAGSGNMPGGNTVGFHADYTLDRAKGSGGVAHGLNAGETLSVSFVLSGLGYDALIAALNTGDVRLGLHVQSVDLGAGSFAATATPTPVPSAVWLMGTGLLGLAAFRVVRQRA